MSRQRPNSAGDSKDKLSRRLLPDAGLTLIMRIGAVLLQVLTFVIISRTHTLSAVGLYAVVNSVFLLTKSVGPMGLDYAAYRYCSTYFEMGAFGHAAGFARFGARRIAVITGAISLLLVLGGILGALLELRDDETLRLLMAAALGVPAYALLGLFSALHRSRGDIVWAQLPDGLVLQGLLGVGIVLFAVAGHIDVSLTVTVQALAAWLSLGLSTWWWRRRSAHVSPDLPTADRNAVAKTANRMLLGLTVTQLAIRSPVVLISAVLGPAAAGLFEAAMRFGLVSTAATVAGSNIVAPLMARAHARADRQDQQDLFTLASLIQTLPALGAFIVLVVLGNWILGTVLGPTFTNAYWPTVLIAFAALFSACAEAASPYLLMKGNENAITRYTFYWLLIVTFGIPPAAYLGGLTAAVCVVVAGVMVRDLGLAMFASRTHGIKPGLLSLSEIVRIVTIARRSGPTLLRQSFKGMG